MGCKFYFQPTTDKNVKIVKSNESFGRGKNLTYNICAGCHYDNGLNKFTGRALNDLPKIGGRLYSANLTNSIDHGIPPRYSDAELFYLLKTGIARDGRFMPYMMRPMMADEDVNDIIVYLRSDDEPVKAGDTTIGKTYLNLVGKTGIRFAAKPQPYNKGVPKPPEDNPLTYGSYLVAITGCYHCHSSKATSVDFFTPTKSKGYMTGGMKLKDANGKKILSPNLTPDKETGIGNFTQSDFRSAVREGIAPSGRKLGPPMDKYDHLTDKQVDAIYKYLMSLPPVHHKI